MTKEIKIRDYINLEKIRILLKLTQELNRGCSCEYDRRCGNCETIIEIKEITKGLTDVLPYNQMEFERWIDEILGSAKKEIDLLPKLPTYN